MGVFLVQFIIIIVRSASHVKFRVARIVLGLKEHFALHGLGRLTSLTCILVVAARRCCCSSWGPRFVGFRCFGVFALYCARNKQPPDDFHVFRTLAAPRQVILKKGSAFG